MWRFPRLGELPAVASRLAARLWSTLRADPTAVLLVIANIVPAVDLQRRGEPLGVLLVIYWWQLAIIGFWNLPKLVLVARWKALFAVPLFALSYGWVLGFFSFIAFGLLDDQLRGTAWRAQFSVWDYWLPAALFFAAHGASFACNFLGRREWEDGAIERQVLAPVRRVFPMALAAFVGGALGSFFTNAAVAALVVLPVKVLLDLYGHLLEHEPQAVPLVPPDTPGSRF